MVIFTKKPYEIWPIDFDFYQEFVANETISSYVLDCYNVETNISSAATIISSSSPSSPSVKVVVKAGTNYQRHHIEVSALTNLGNQFDKDMFLDIRERIDSELEKQPKDEFDISINFNNVMESADTISTAVITVTKQSDNSDATGDIIFGYNIDNTTRQVIIGIIGGSSYEQYRIVCKIVSGNSYQYQHDLMLTVREV